MEGSQPSDEQALQFLAIQGWLPLVLADHPGLVEAYASLFKAAEGFFASPEDSTQKTSYQAASGALASEEGYSKIPSEKTILTVKISDHCPACMHEKAEDAWNTTGIFLSKVLEAIARSLELKPDVFAPFVEPCKSLPKDKRTPTLLRMFRYDRPAGPDAKVNAEKHKDLGLLSLVVGRSPGLHALNTITGLWVPVEDDAVLPPGSRTRSDGLTATLLGGETLAFLTRDKYKAGAHGVICAPPSPEFDNDPYRYSVVFTLRPAVAPIYTSNFESEITGRFGDEEKADGENSAALFARIRKTHYNVNVAPEIREKQREEQKKRLEALRGQG